MIKIGDKVTIVDIGAYGFDHKLEGKEGIVDVIEKYEFGYQVLFDSGYSAVFKEEELELIPRQGPNTERP